MSIVAIHQPNFIPWCGYFAKILVAEKFVFLDSAQFSKGSYQNRVKIKTSQGPIWLTENVKKEKASFVSSNIVKLVDFDRWKLKHLKTIQANYSRSSNFSFFYDQLSEFYTTAEFEYMCDFNIALIELCCSALGVETNKFFRSSDLEISSSNDDALIEICKRVNANSYLSGSGGRNYQDEPKFLENEISVIYSNFEHPNYSQLWDGFDSGLSILDLLLNEGKSAGKILRGSIIADS